MSGSPPVLIGGSQLYKSLKPKTLALKTFCVGLISRFRIVISTPLAKATHEIMSKVGAKMPYCFMTEKSSIQIDCTKKTPPEKGGVYKTPI